MKPGYGRFFLYHCRFEQGNPFWYPYIFLAWNIPRLGRIKHSEILFPAAMKSLCFRIFLIMAGRPGKPGFTLYLYRQNPLRRHEWISSSFGQQDSRKIFPSPAETIFVAMQSQAAVRCLFINILPLVQNGKNSLSTLPFCSNNLSPGLRARLCLCGRIPEFHTDIEFFCSFTETLTDAGVSQAKAANVFSKLGLTSPKTV